MYDRIIEEDLLINHRIIAKDTEQGEKIHEFLLSRAKKMASHLVDFDKTPVTFVMSDVETPNACYIPITTKENRPSNSDYDDIRYCENPYKTPIICVTKGLIDLVDNIDQLDFVLGHELTHMILKDYGIGKNSKGEEAIADLHSVDLVYDAGSDPKQALEFEKKVDAYAKALKREKAWKKHKKEEKEKKNSNINWSEVFDVHLTRSNAKSAIEASLTRISHLIDDRKPSEIDKSVFDVKYTDPVDEFLEKHDYEDKTHLGKIKILVDAVKELSHEYSAEQYYRARIDELHQEMKALGDIEDEFSTKYDYYKLQQKAEELEEKIAEGSQNAYPGPILERKYQQKIAKLAEEAPRNSKEDAYLQPKRMRNLKHFTSAAAIKNYILNAAYEEIKENGYPKPKEDNYYSASALMYTYFHTLLSVKFPTKNHFEDDVQSLVKKSDIEKDIEKQHEVIRTTKDKNILFKAINACASLHEILENIKSTSLGEGYRGNKLSGLTFIANHYYDDEVLPKIYSDSLEKANAVEWNNLIAVAKEYPETKDQATAFLKSQGIEDFRLTHNAPFVRLGKWSTYKVDDKGTVVDRATPDELDYAINKNIVLKSYEYIKNYFDNEDQIFDQTCNSLFTLTNVDFTTYSEKPNPNSFERLSLAQQAIYNFVSLYNSQLSKRDLSDSYNRSDLMDFIPRLYLSENPVPWKDGKKSLIEKDALSFNSKIFQKHFGEDYNEKLIAQKQKQTDKLFATTLKALDVFTKAYNEASYIEGLYSKKLNKLQKKRWATKNKDLRKKLEEPMEKLNEEAHSFKAKKDSISSMLYNYTHSALNTRVDSPWHISKLTAEQKKTIAEYVALDKNKTFVKLFRDGDAYMAFCTSADILQEQIDQVIAGNYNSTERMQIVAENTNYRKTDPVIKKHRKDKKHYSYTYYLRLFDDMKHLETAPNVDLVNLSKSLYKITRNIHNNGNSYGVEDVSSQSYVRTIRDTNLIPLLSKALKHKENFNGLSFQENLILADNLISARNDIAQMLIKRISNYDTDEVKIEGAPEHKKFINLLDITINNSLEKAYKQALGNENALEKMRDLYCLYHKESYCSDTADRKQYLRNINQTYNSLGKLAKFSAKETFWPEDVLEHIKAYTFAKNTFIDDIKLEDKLLNAILDKLEKTSDVKQKEECFTILLDKNLRASYPETRQKLFDLYIDYTASKLGKDDSSTKYQEALKKYLEDFNSKVSKDWDIGHSHRRSDLLSNSIAMADKYVILKTLSNSIVSQQETSKMLKHASQANIEREDLAKSYLYGIGVDALTSAMDDDANIASNFIKFLNSKGEMKDCGSFSKDLQEYFKDKWSYEEKINKIQLENCKSFYENFWSAPLQARAIVIGRILKSAITKQDTDNSETSWEEVFDLVMDNMINPDDQSVESNYARDIMHSYIKSRSNYERELILSAMMVANRNIGKDAGNVGKALKLFLENMGPAEIKLGQAVASHPNTPDSIRKPLQDLKNQASMPARWEIYEWIEQENIPEDYWKDKYVGEVLGSASYYTTIALGDNEVLRLLRPEAREKAEKGFRVLASTVEDLKKKDSTSGLNYQELTSSVSEMISQANKMSDIETDHKSGKKQYKSAQKIYNGVTIKNKNHTFSFRVMDWQATGKNWIIMNRAEGSTFNNMPATTGTQKEYKQSFAMAYIAFELRNILSGKKFDHDRHGDQLCINPETNEVGIFDTGAMALKAPTPQEQKLLGKTICELILSSNKKLALSKLGSTLSNKIEALHKEKTDTQYLVEVQKGILALGDFFRTLKANDIRTILEIANLPSAVSQNIKAGIVSAMEAKESKKSKSIALRNIFKINSSAHIKKKRIRNNVSVTYIKELPTTKRKASWLQSSFANSKKNKQCELPETINSNKVRPMDMINIASLT